MIRLGSSLLWSYRLKCLLLRDVGVWFSALSVEIGSVEHWGRSLPAHIDRSLSVRAQAHIAISVEYSQFLGNPDMQIYANSNQNVASLTHHNNLASAVNKNEERY